MTKKLPIIGIIMLGLSGLLMLFALISNALNSKQDDTAGAQTTTTSTPAIIEPTDASLGDNKNEDKVFGAQEFTLSNGLRGIVIPNHRAPVVMHMVWYKAGAADEPRGTSGIAHFMEHLMFKGSETSDGRALASGEFSKIVKSLGGRDNAFTGQDYTAYFQSAAAEHLETLMQMEAGRMKGFMPPEDEVDSERLVILEERSQRTDNTPSGKFDENIMAGLYVNHPYGTPIIGWRHEMEKLSRQDALDFHEKYYAPNNAVLIVSGDVTLAEVQTLAKQTYGTLPARATPPRERTTLPALDGNATYRYHHPNVRQPQWQRVYAVPSIRTDKDASLALEVLQDILGGGSTSRLYKSLVIEQKLASTASLFYRANGWSGASLYIVATPLPNVSMDQITAAVDVEIQTLSDNGITPEELSDSITRMQDSAVYARDSLRGPAVVVGAALATGASLDHVEYWPEHIGNVSAHDIQNVAQTYLAPLSDETRFVTGHLLPEKKPAPAPALQENEEDGAP